MTTKPCAKVDARSLRRGVLPDDMHSEPVCNLTTIVIHDAAIHLHKPVDGSVPFVDVRSWSAQCYERISDKPVRADGLTVKQFLAQPEIGSAYRTIEDIAVAVLEARQRRTELLRQIAMLDDVEHIFSAAERQAAAR